MAVSTEALEPAVLLLGAGVVSIIGARLLGTSAILGFLVAGLVLGPGGLALIRSDETTMLLAELGVVFLLFELGTHFSLAKVWEQRRDILLLGPLQCLLCAVPLTLIAHWGFNIEWTIAIALGGALALSSTAVVARVIQDRNQNGCPVGKSAIGVVVFQDILAVFLIIYAASLGADQSNGGLGALLGLAALKAFAGFALAATLGPWLLKPLFALLARTKTEEAFTVAALLLVTALSLFSAEIGLSMTLGAFLAGMMIAATPYRHVVSAEAKPFRGLLLGFFFISIGMMLDIRFLIANAPVIVALAAGLLVLKTGLIWIAARLSGWSVPGAVQLSFLISQVGELAFVILAATAVAQGLTEGPVAILIAAIALTLAVTPAYSELGMKLARTLVKMRGPLPAELDDTQPNPPQAGDQPDGPVHTLVVGANPVGLRVADALRAFQIPHLVIEADIDRFRAAAADGYPMIFGNAADLRLLQSMGIANVRVVAVAQPDAEVSRELTPTMKTLYPRALRFVTIDDPDHEAIYLDLGMRPVLARSPIVGLDLAALVLAESGTDALSVARWVAVESGEDPDRPLAELAMAV
jgi:CPA2 family monovalent cation:H+ antiporter-2